MKAFLFVLMLLCSAGYTHADAQQPVHLERNKQLVRDFYRDVWNVGTAEAGLRFYTPDFKSHPGTLATIGAREWVDRAQQFLNAFPGAKFTVEDMVAEGDLVTMRGHVTGVQTAPFVGIPSKGNTINLGGIFIYRIKDGRIAEEWHIIDEAGLMAQITR